MEYQSLGPTTRQVSVSEASRELNVSPETVRRWIKSGRLSAERAIRPQGAVWLVTLPATSSCGVLPVTPVTMPPDGPDQGPAHVPSDEVCDPSSPVTVPVTAVAALAATVRQQSEALERLTGEVAELREERGELRAQFDHARVTIDELKAAGEARKVQLEYAAATIRRLILAVAVLIALALAAGTLAAAGWVR